MSGPLEGLRVVEHVGPLGQLAGKLLADMGADVVTIEPPAGSEARAIGPFVDDEPGPNRSLNYWYHNTNKRSVVLDLATSEGVRTWCSLIAKADIVIEDRAPGELDRLDAGYATLGATPGLIWCAITPFGQDGPWASYQATDMIGLALGGPMKMNGYDEADVPGAPPFVASATRGTTPPATTPSRASSLRCSIATVPAEVSSSTPPCMKPAAARLRSACPTGSHGRSM